MTTVAEHGARDAPRPHAAWNFAVLAADVTCFFVGLAFLDAATVLPALVSGLGGGPVVLGLMAALRHAGFFLPQLFVAHRLHGRVRYLPFLLGVCFAGRIGLWGAAAALFWLGKPAPTLALAALAAAYALLWLGDGAGGVPWTAIVGRAIPSRRRGRFFATTQVLGGLGRIGAGLVVARALGGKAIPFPASGALLVLLCALFMALSFVFLALIREPPPSPDAPPAQTPRPPLGAYLRTLPAHLRARPFLGRLALAQVLSGSVGAVFPFYLGFARATIAPLPSGIEGRFLIAHTLGGLLCAPLWGWLTDRQGARAALLALFGLALLSPALAGAGGMLGAGVWAFFGAYFCFGAVLEGGWAIFTNYLLEAVPEAEQPTHIGMMSLLNAPALLLPLAAGLVVRTLGAPALLIAAGLLLTAGLGITAGLPDPRRTGHR